jgi:hypothetical protein
MAAPDRLTRREPYVVHQIQPAKLATDISVSVVSTVLFWQHGPIPGVLVFAVPAPIASALVRPRDLSAYRDSPAGRYVLAHMPPSMQAVRSVSAVALAVDGWRRSPALVLPGSHWSASAGHTDCSQHAANPARQPPAFRTSPWRGGDGPGADQGAGEPSEGREALVDALGADPQPAAAHQPGDGAFDLPTVAAQPVGGVDAPAAIRP